MNDAFIPFKAHWLFRGGVTQTVLATKLPGEAVLPARKTHKIQIGPKSTIIALELDAKNPDSSIVLLAHGMGGCSESGYMRRIAAKLWSRGFGVFMMNHRGSGPGLGLSDALWNGGSSDDLEHMVHHIVGLYPKRPVLVVGFSLSGNLLLKYLGEGKTLPTNLHGGFAVNPPIDLKVSSKLISKNNGGGIFNKYYMKLIHRQCEALAECHPETFLPLRKYKTIWDFDEGYTAHAGGYADGEDYYAKSSSKQFLKSIKIPTLILCAKDDPFIPHSVFEDLELKWPITTSFPDRGGHMGYLTGKLTPFGDHRWMDYRVVHWVENLE